MEQNPIDYFDKHTIQFSLYKTDNQKIPPFIGLGAHHETLDITLKLKELLNDQDFTQ